MTTTPNGPSAAPSLIEFSAAMAIFAGELFDHEPTKGGTWNRQSVLHHVQHAEEHFKRARILLTNAGVGFDIAAVEMEIYHGQSRGIMATEVWLRGRKMEAQ